MSIIFSKGFAIFAKLATEQVGERVFSIRVPFLSLCPKRHNLQGLRFDYVCMDYMYS